MKKIFNAFIERLDKETGYGYDRLVELYNYAMDVGVSVADFVDDILDGNVR